MLRPIARVTEQRKFTDSTGHIKTISYAFTNTDPGFRCIKTERGRGYRWVPWRTNPPTHLVPNFGNMQGNYSSQNLVEEIINVAQNSRTNLKKTATGNVFNSGSLQQKSPATPVLSVAARLNATLLVLTCYLVSACGDVEKIEQPLAKLKPEPLLVEVVPVATALKTLPQEVEVLLQPEPTAAPQTDVDPVVEQVVLDLNLSTAILATGYTEVSSLELDMNRLPDLFEQSEKEPKTSFNIELLRDENIPQATIDGLNLTIERRLGG